jgi:hypothetical protein
MAAALALALSTAVQADVKVTKSGDRLDVTAAEAPVSEVLDGLARQTRMKIVYEGAAPRTPVTVELRGRTPAQAVLGVLEGLGLNYALVLDASGTEVETLMIVGTGARVAAGGSDRAPRGSTRRQAPHATPEDPIVESDEPPPEVEEAGVPAVSPEVQKVEESAKREPVMGPINPSGAPRFPSPPLPPGPVPLVTPSPSPNPPSSN